MYDLTPAQHRAGWYAMSKAKAKREDRERLMRLTDRMLCSKRMQDLEAISEGYPKKLLDNLEWLNVHRQFQIEWQGQGIAVFKDLSDNFLAACGRLEFSNTFTSKHLDKDGTFHIDKDDLTLQRDGGWYGTE